MRLFSFVTFVLLISLAHGQLPAAAAASASLQQTPTFFGPSLGDVTKPYKLTLEPNRPDVIGWQIDWGDGNQQTDATADSGPSHLYEKPGRYVIHIKAKLPDGTAVTPTRDYGRLLQQSYPVAATDVPSGESAASQETLNFLTAIASNHPVVIPPIALDKVFAKPVDRFSVEFWLRVNDLTARQEVLDARGVSGKPTRLYLQNGALHLLLGGGYAFDQPLGPRLQAGTWHHVALTYDRDQTFPFSNAARFYLDGVLIGEHHLDIYDTGPVAMPSASIGAAADATDPINGSVAELAIYDRWLNPAVLLDRAVFAPGEQVVVIAPKNAETFSVDQPRISRTVEVALNPDPTADNGPAFVRRSMERGRVPECGWSTRRRMPRADVSISILWKAVGIGQRCGSPTKPTSSSTAAMLILCSGPITGNFR